MILFIDGMDGTGKTTLVSQLLRDLAEKGQPALEAPQLWTFLEPITSPHDFGDWVQRTPGIEVGRHLLVAMVRRLDKLRTDSQLGVIDRKAVVLVDRGPRTVLSSARSHAATGLRADTRQGDETLHSHQQQLVEKVACLVATDMTLSVFLYLNGGPAVAIQRLAGIEHLRPAYLRYLRRLHHEITSHGCWPSMPERRLPATVARTSIAADVLKWISPDGPAVLMRGSPR